MDAKVERIHSHIDEKLDQIAVKLDLATIGLVAIANHEMQELDIRRCEPDAESSPSRLSTPITDRTLDRKSAGTVVRADVDCAIDLKPTTLKFDIYARDDVCEVGVQAYGEWEPLILDHCVDFQNGTGADEKIKGAEGESNEHGEEQNTPGMMEDKPAWLESFEKGWDALEKKC